MKIDTGDKRLINWVKMPFLKIVLFYIIGILIAANFRFDHGFVIPLILGLITYVYAAIKIKLDTLFFARVQSILLSLCFILLGILMYKYQLPQNQKNHFQYSIQKKENTFQCKILEPIKRNKNSSSALVKVEALNDNETIGQLLLYFNKLDTLNYTPGDIILASGKIQKIPPPRNPMAFDYARYLKYEQIYHQCFLKAGAHTLIEKGRLVLPIHYAQKVRAKALNILADKLDDEDRIGVAAAMILGNRAALSEELRTSFSDTGSIHVLAVSGMHVGIVVSVFLFLFAKIRSEKPTVKIIKFIILMSIVWSYALITGSSPAVLRAATMFSLIILGTYWFDSGNIFNILAFSAFILLLVNPFQLFQLSFLFSYIALISILFFQPFLDNLYYPRTWIGLYLWKLTTVSISAQILIFPLTIFFFHKFPLMFILSSIVAVILAYFILIFGILLLLIHAIPFLSEGVAYICGWLLDALIYSISSIQKIPLTINDIYISPLSTLFIYIFLLAFMAFLAFRHSKIQDTINPGKEKRTKAQIIMLFAILGLACNHIYHTYNIHDMKRLTIYDISKASAFDINENGKYYAYKSSTLSEKKATYAYRNYRLYNGVRKPLPIDSSEIVSDQFHYRAGMLNFENIVLVMAKHFEDQDIIPARSDIVYLNDNTTLFPYDFLEVHHTKKVIVDGSINYEIKNRWRKECENKNITFYDTSREGAFILEN